MATVSNDSDSGPLGSVSNDSANEPESTETLPKLIQGNKGTGTDPSFSAPILLKRGTETRRPPTSAGRVFESILGEDERTRIPDTDRSPWNMIISLNIKGRNGRSFVGTGWFAGPKTIITAGHCVHGQEMGGWAKEIVLVPGRNGNARPFGELRSTKFSTTDRWFKEANPDYDYAAIHLDESAKKITEKTGWFATTALPDHRLVPQLVNISGYPGDKGNPIGNEQWFHAKQVLYVTPCRIYYDVDTYAGQSGAPVWLDRDTGPEVVGIHAYGVGGASHLEIKANSGPRINDEVFDVLKGWIEKE